MSRLDTTSLVAATVCLLAAWLAPACAEGEREAAGRERLIFFEDFESRDYARNWRVHWGQAAGAGTVAASSGQVFAGERSAFLQSEAGKHEALGSGEYVPERPIDDVAHVRLHLRLDDRFEMGTANQLKLFGVRGGAAIENSYGGAGKRPDGEDKFSVRVAINGARELHLYAYHADQSSRYGDHLYCRGRSCAPKLKPGRWYCLELMVKNNTPGENDGELLLWKDGEPLVHAEGLRFRDVAELKIRRFTIESYFGGGGAKNTSPRDQRLLIDDFAIGRERIGCSAAD